MPLLEAVLLWCEAQRYLALPAVNRCLHSWHASILTQPAVPPGLCGIAPIVHGHAGELWWWWWWWCWAFSKLYHLCSKLFPEGLLRVWLCHGGLIPDLEQLLVEKETVHHGNVHKMIKESFVPFHGFVVDAVICNQSIRQIHTAHVLIIISYSVWDRYGLGLPHTSLFYFTVYRLSTEGLMHCRAHAHFPGVHPLHKQEFVIPDPLQISPLSLLG